MNSYLQEHPFCIEEQDSGDIIYLVGISGASSNVQATITQYPTVSGAKISDNMYVEPVTLSFSLTASYTMDSKQRVSTDKSGRIVTLSTQELKDRFKTWLTDGYRLNITTFENYYPNMVLRSMSENESDNLTLWRPSLSFVEARVATIQTIKLQNVASALEKADNSDEQANGANNGIASFGSVLGATGAGALVGATIGSFFPGPGTAIGAAIGGIAGFFRGLF